jgi:hypothetical protein
MVKSTSIFLLMFTLLMKSAPSFAWGFEGHKIVAEIAKSHLNKSVKDSVEKYLGDMSFEDAATWMDDMRKDHAYDYMKPWHYVNIEKDKTFVKTNDENLINELEIIIKALNSHASQSKKDLNTDIKIAFHLVGDLHMPLHVGYADDKGGNAVEVDILGRHSNLHRVWDTDILEAKKITLGDCEKLASSFSAKEIKEIQKIDVVAWANQSRAYLPDVYALKDGKITEEYINKNAPIVARQITIAGLRLAAVLNNAFSK